MASRASAPSIVNRPSYRPRSPRIIVDAERRQATVDGRAYALVGIGKTAWKVVDLETGQVSSFRISPDPDGDWAVCDVNGEPAASVGAAWLWACRQLVQSPLPPRESLH